MDIFSVIKEFFASLPQWVCLLPPALFLVCAVPIVILRRRDFFRWTAALCLVFGGLLTCHTGESFLYLLLFFGVILLVYPLCLLPKRKRESRDERLYGRFREELEGPMPESKPVPPKVCCFEETGETAEARGMQLSHVIALLEKLKKEKLTPADRLEVEMLSRSVEGARTRPLTDRQTDDLNDSLSAILRLVAKYS